MGILFEKLPSSVTVGEREYPINTDYRCMAKFEQAMLTTDRGDRKATAKIFYDALSDFYQGDIPADVDEAIKKMWWFYRCGEPVDSKTNKAGTKDFKRLYDYEIDGALIISAFADTYGIDIVNKGLHWWLFRSYFTGLNDDTRFVQIMSYRGMDLREFKGKLRQRYAKLQEKYALPVIKQTPMNIQERDELFLKKMRQKMGR